MVAAGVRARVTLPLGGKLDMPAIGRRGVPRPLYPLDSFPSPAGVG